MTVQVLKRQALFSVISVLILFIALSSSTYAWFVSNSNVDATSSTISAMTDNFVLQIASLSEGAQHGSNQSLVATTSGHTISPSSTNNLKDWYVSLGWGQDGMVHSYMQADIKPDGEYTKDKTGTYTINPPRYAFIKSEYILYTVTQTGLCDVYLAADGDIPAIQVTASGSATSDVIPKSMRVGLTIQDLEGNTAIGDEELILVYAPYDETGKGNDASGIDGWTYVNANAVSVVTYPHVYETNYIWTDSSSNQHDYAAHKNGSVYEAPSANGTVLASDVDYDGKILRVYIWIEGTDEQCVNNSAEEDTSVYNVTVSLAGVTK